MPIELAPPFHDLTFMTPLSDQHADALVRFLSDGAPELVVDAGCGWAELLLRVVAADPGTRGLGIDLDASSVAHGRALAARRGLADRIALRVGDAKSLLPDRVDALICIGASQIWGPPVEDEQPLDYRAALRALRAPLRQGGRLVYGEGIWSRPPTEAATNALSGRPDELQHLPQVLDIAVEEGFQPIAVSEATQAEWDEFESGYSACHATWLSQHEADHPDAAEVRSRADRQRRSYYAGYRGILGMVHLSLLAV